jgi:hypothetical protein
MTLPDTRFYLDVNGDGSFSKDITDKVLLLNGMTIKRGREDWQGGVTAGELSITLNNADGRFTPGSTILGSPSPIKVDQRIRVKETINGVTLNRFTGYVKQWPVAWPATVPTWSTVTITVTDAQPRAERQPLRSIVEQEILQDSPLAYYTLGEPGGVSSAADSSGSQATPLSVTGAGAALTFGTAIGPSTDGLTAVQFAGGQYLTATIGATVSGFGLAFSRDSLPATSEFILEAPLPLGGAVNAHTLMMQPDGKIAVGTSSIVSASSYADGATHWLEMTFSAGTWTLYIDGVSIGTRADSAFPAGRYDLGSTGSSGTGGFGGVLAHFVLFSAAPSVSRVSAHSDAVRTGFVGEAGTARITRLAGYANLPVGTLDASLTNVAFTDITGKSVWEALQQVTDAEMGLSFFDGSGDLTFHNRNRAASKTSPDLTLDKQYLTADVQPVTDDQQIINYLDGSSTATGVTQLVWDVTSEVTNNHGRYAPGTVEYLVQTDQEVLDRLNWIVTNFAEPTTRYGTLTINLFKMTASQAQSVLSAIEPNCWLRVTSMPSQNTGGATIDVVVQGFTEEQGGDSWLLRCNVVSQSLYEAFILDSSTRGVLDSDRLYV